MSTLKPRRLGRDTKITLGVVGLLLVVVIVAIVGGFFGHGTSAPAPTPTVTQAQLSTRAQVMADVRETTTNVKAYLKAHPRASNTVIQNAKVANTRPATQRINIAGNYQLWYVVGTDTRLSADENYTYQSLSNTYRWYNNKTGKSTQISEDAAPRNSGARR